MKRTQWGLAGVIIAILAIMGGMILALGVPSRGSVPPVSAQTIQATERKTLTAQGQGQVQMQPTEASITLGVETRAADARSALDANGTKMKAVTAAITGQGVAAKDIQTTNLSLYYDAEHQQQVAQHSLTVRLDGIDTLGAVLDAAVGAGANTSWGVTFGVKDQSTARSAALKSAIADARQHADDMAAALGGKISGVAGAEEATFGYAPVNGPQSMAGAGGGTVIQPGELTVTASVRVTYGFDTQTA